MNVSQGVSSDSTSLENPNEYWFMRMIHGQGGTDYTKELWESGRVGVLWGTWRMPLVLDENGEVDPAKLRASVIQGEFPNDKWLKDHDLEEPRRFLLQLKPGHRVVVIFDEAVHIGTIGSGYIDDPKPRGDDEEHFKCRPVIDRKRFPLNELPCSFRLLSNTGRRAIQQVHSCYRQVVLLDRCDSARAVRNELKQMPASDFLAMLSPGEWERICVEYLRDTVGFRSLLLDVGRTLKDVDIIGVDPEFRRVIAQCKNGPNRIDASVVQAWRQHSAVGKDQAFYFCRGGCDGPVEDCTVIDGEQITAWLESNLKYFTALKTL